MEIKTKFDIGDTVNYIKNSLKKKETIDRIRKEINENQYGSPYIGEYYYLSNIIGDSEYFRDDELFISLDRMMLVYKDLLD